MQLVIRITDGTYLCACPDGHEFSERELAHPDWMIVSVPLTMVECEALCDRERFSIDVDGLEPSMDADVFRALIRDNRE